MRRLAALGLAMLIGFAAPAAAHATGATIPPKPTASIVHDSSGDGGEMAEFSLNVDYGDNGGDPSDPTCLWSFSPDQTGDGPYLCHTLVVVTADNQTICYTVTVTNSVGTSEPSDPACEYVAWTPPAPTNVAAVQTALYQATLTWDDVPPSGVQDCCPAVESQVNGAACSSPCVVGAFPLGQHCYSVRSRYPVWAAWGPPESVCLDTVDPRPDITVRDSSRLERNAGTHLARVRIRLSAPAAGTESVTLQTSDGTATAPSDYVAKTWAVDVPAGATSVITWVSIKGDRAAEPDESFTVQVVDASGVQVLDDTGQVTIVNDD